MRRAAIAAVLIGVGLLVWLVWSGAESDGNLRSTPSRGSPIIPTPLGSWRVASFRMDGFDVSGPAMPNWDGARLDFRGDGRLEYLAPEDLRGVQDEAGRPELRDLLRDAFGVSLDTDAVWRRRGTYKATAQTVLLHFESNVEWQLEWVEDRLRQRIRIRNDQWIEILWTRPAIAESGE
jgi:hypothetical protein